MGLFALFGRRPYRHFSWRRSGATSRRPQPAPLAPRRLERRRVLDAAAADLWLGALADAGRYVQAGEQTTAAVAAAENASVKEANQAPTNVRLYLGASDILENEELQLGVMFEDANAKDTHKAIIDWGDGTPPEVFAIEPGARYLGTAHQFRTAHQYLDDNPSATSLDVNTIKVRIFDTAGKSATATAAVTVKNVPPTIDTLSISRIVEGEYTTLAGTFSDPGTQDTFALDIDWDGDHAFDQTVTVSGGEFEVSRQFLDDNPTGTWGDTFDVHVRLRDDDAGFDIENVSLTVNNAAPIVALADVMDVFENNSATLSGTFTDSGLLDPHRLTIDWDDPNHGVDAVFEVSAIYAIDPQSDVLSPQLQVGDVLLSLTAGDLTTLAITSIDVNTGAVGFQSAHQYLDDGIAAAAAPGANGTLSDKTTIRVTVEDDDEGLECREATFQVRNKKPEIYMQSVTPSSINESESVTLSGKFRDPGGLDFHAIEIRWGDGAVDGEGGDLTFIQEVSGSGSFIATHTYADNDTENPDDLAKDNLYSIAVTVTDDDGGKSTRVIDLEVLNVDPVLEPIAAADATDVNTKGETFVTITFSDIGADALTIWVDWGDLRDPANPFVPGDDPFVAETPTSIVGPLSGPGTYTVTLAHTYAGPPNPLSPAADIDLRVVVVDDDFDFAAAGGQVDGSLQGQPIREPGRSEFRTATITNPGIGAAPVVIDTTPQVPRLIFPQQEEMAFYLAASSADEAGLQTLELRSAVGDTKSATDRFLELRVIDAAAGEEGEGYRLPPEVLNDLPGLFRTLPDNRYAIYLVRTETNTRRLVIEVYVRNGKLIDPGDDSEGTRDRPPTDETAPEATEQPQLQVEPDQQRLPEPAQPAAADEVPVATPPGPPAATSLGIPGDRSAASAARPNSQQALALRAEVDVSGGCPAAKLLGPAVVGLAASKSARAWVERINQTIATADRQQWDRLRHRRRSDRK